MPFASGPRRTALGEDGETAYPCMWEGCDKRFGTAAHVRRHEKTHVGSTPYGCPYCDKTFGRSDVRAKHVTTMHPGEAEVQLDAREGSGSVEPPRKAMKLEGNTSPLRSRSISAAEYMLPLPPPEPTFAPTWTPSQSSSLGVEQTLYAGPSPRSTDLANLMLPPSSSAFTPAGFLDPANLSTALAPPTGVPDATGDLFDDPLGSNWELFSNVFGWGLDNDIDLDIGLQNSLFDNSDIGPISSTNDLSAAWLMSFTPRQGSPVGNAAEEQTKDPFGRNHETPWPNMFKPKVPDRPLTLGGVKASPRAARARDGPDPVGPANRNAMLSLIYLAHQAHWLMPDIDDFPDQETLSDFVDLYFEKFHPTFPILRRASISTTDTPPVLLMAIAAVGATYANPEFKPLAVALSELVRRMVQWMRASDQRMKFDKSAIAAYLLHAIVAIACGSREMMLHAETSRASLLTTARRLHHLRPGRTAMDELASRAGTPSLEDRWKAYIEDEGKRRLGWGAYMLDAQMTDLLGVPATFSIHEIGVPLPGDDAAWNAPTAQEWAKIHDETPFVPKWPFLKVLGSFMTGQGERAPITDFGKSIVSHTLYRLSLDAYYMRQALEADDDLARSLSSPLNAKPHAALLALARAPSLFTDPTPLRLSSAALYHHSRIALSRIGLLEHVKCASGKFEPDITKKAAIRWLQEWVKEGPEMRKVLWHAGVLNALLTQFPGGAIAEQFWIFDCAIVLWAVVKYGGKSLRTSDIKSALFAANWFDTEPPGVWVQHGGTIFFPFLGSSSALETTTLLQFFIERLERIPWGMSTLFSQVLEKLAEEEGSVPRLAV